PHTFVPWFRSVAPHIHAHRGKTFVVGLSGELIAAGKAKAGDKTEIKYKLAVSYYRLSINGQVLIEIDPVNFVEVVNGIDRLAQVRAALGI
ncbi:phage major tail tube protein, partial [Bacillus cereus]|nr:phage major tail tube protein [Bacillus cereus]